MTLLPLLPPKNNPTSRRNFFPADVVHLVLYPGILMLDLCSFLSRQPRLHPVVSLRHLPRDVPASMPVCAQDAALSEQAMMLGQVRWEPCRSRERGGVRGERNGDQTWSQS